MDILVTRDTKGKIRVVENIFELTDLEIIGNVHKNADLLEDK